MGRLLVVEEDDDLRESLVALLECWGHEVAATSEGHEALALVAAFRPDIVVVHLGLPGELTGPDVMRRIRVAEGWRTFIITLTGWARPQDRAEALTAGANVCVLKPPDAAYLERTIAEALEKLNRRHGI